MERPNPYNPQKPIGEHYTAKNRETTTQAGFPVGRPAQTNPVQPPATSNMQAHNPKPRRGGGGDHYRPITPRTHPPQLQSATSYYGSYQGYTHPQPTNPPPRDWAQRYTYQAPPPQSMPFENPLRPHLTQNTLYGPPSAPGAELNPLRTSAPPPNAPSAPRAMRHVAAPRGPRADRPRYFVWRADNVPNNYVQSASTLPANAVVGDPHATARQVSGHKRKHSPDSDSANVSNQVAQSLTANQAVPALANVVNQIKLSQPGDVEGTASDWAEKLKLARAAKNKARKVAKKEKKKNAQAASGHSGTGNIESKGVEEGSTHISKKVKARDENAGIIRQSAQAQASTSFDGKKGAPGKTKQPVVANPTVKFINHMPIRSKSISTPSKPIPMDQLSSPSPLPTTPKGQPSKRSRIPKPSVFISPSPEKSSPMQNSPVASSEPSPSKTIVVDTGNSGRPANISPTRGGRMRMITGQEMKEIREYVEKAIEQVRPPRGKKPTDDKSCFPGFQWRPYQCPKCHTKLILLPDLEHHLNDVHMISLGGEKIRAWKCFAPRCDGFFTNRQEGLRHAREAHFGVYAPARMKELGMVDGKKTKK